MLVWHVQYDSYVWSTNRVNNTPSHQYVDIEEADGSQSDYSRDGDSFPGASNKTSFGDTGTPNMKMWNGQGFTLPLTDIAETGGIITFKVAGGTSDIPAPEVEMDGTPDNITLFWQPCDYDLIVSLYKLNTLVNTPYAPDGDAIYANVNCGRSGTYVFENLEPQTDYMITCNFLNGLQSSATGYGSCVTGRPGLDRLTVVSLEPEDINDKEFTARWELLPEASDYLITVYERIFGAPYVDTWDFTGFDNSIVPEGWESTGTTTYANSAYSGAAVPALRMGNGDKVTTPVFDDDLRTISFWHRGSNTSADDRLALYFRNAQGTWNLFNEYEITTEKGGSIISVDVPAGNRTARISYKRYGAKGNVALDDVTVEHGLTYGNRMLENYNAVATGNSDSFVVTGLEPEHTYCYEVAGTDGTLVSRKSAMQTATTLQSTGLTEAAASHLKVSSAGGVITVTGTAEGAIVEVIDLSGRIIAKTAASTAGVAVLPVGQAGFYIVRTGNDAIKTGVR